MAAFLEIEVTFGEDSINRIKENGLYVFLFVKEGKHELKFNSPWEGELESSKYDYNRRDLYYPSGYVESPIGPIILNHEGNSTTLLTVDTETNSTVVNVKITGKAKANTLKLVKTETFAFSKEIDRTNFVYFSPAIMSELFNLTNDYTFIFFGSEQSWGLNDTDQSQDIEAFGRSFTLGIKIKNIERNNSLAETDLLTLYGVPLYLPKDSEPKMIAVLGNSCPYGWVPLKMLKSNK